MTKLLQGRLPIELEPTVRGDTFNRAVRVLELSLDRVDPDKTPVFSSDERDELNSWQNISTPTTSGLSATANLGEIQVIASGSIVVEVG